MIRGINSTANSSGVQQLDDHYKALAERIRHMRTSLGDSPGLVGITSSVAGEGVTTVARNLATTSASLFEQPVLLVDANFNRPQLSSWLGDGPEAGLADLLLRTHTLDDVTQSVANANLSVIHAGTPAARLRAAYDPSRVEHLFQLIRAQFALALFDLPAATETSSCFSIAGMLDGVLLVLEAERARTQVAHVVKKRLLDVQARPLGVVLNKRRRHVPGWLYKWL